MAVEIFVWGGGAVRIVVTGLAKCHIELMGQSKSRRAIHSRQNGTEEGQYEPARFYTEEQEQEMGQSTSRHARQSRQNDEKKEQNEPTTFHTDPAEEEVQENDATPENIQELLERNKAIKERNKWRKQEQELMADNLESEPDPLYNKTEQNTLQEQSIYDEKLKEICCEMYSILLLGMVGSGKSSFIESIKTYSEDKLTNYLPKGEADETNTICLERIRFSGANEKLNNIELWDIAGLQEETLSGGVLKLNCDKTLNHIKDILEGRIANGFTYTKELREEDRESVSATLRKQSIVLACRAKECSHRLEQKKTDEDFKLGWTKILRLLRGARLSPVVILTGCDEISEEVKSNPSVILRSYRVQQAISAAAKLFEVAPVNVLPVVNYTDQISTNVKLHQPLLYALSKIIESARCFNSKVKSTEDDRKTDD